MAPGRRTWRSRARDVVHHVRVAMALKTAVAASVAWLVALQMPAPAPEYAFYGPLGAVVVMYPTVASSVQQSLRAGAAISLGALLALAADAWLGHGTLVVAVVVGLGVLLGGLPWLGTQRSYVPIAALFVLVIGQGQELAYSAVYAGLFVMGALVTVLVNAAYPSLPVRQADHAVQALRDAVRAHLVYLARVLRGEEETLSDRAPGRPPLTEPTAAARAAVRQVRESVRGNRRASRSGHEAGGRWEVFRALERVVLLVEDFYQLLSDEPWGQDVRRAPTPLRMATARTLDALAGVVEAVGEGTHDPSVRADADAALDEVTWELRRSGADDDAQALVVATVVTNVRRSLALMAPTRA